jgi:hypothetical protein
VWTSDDPIGVPFARPRRYGSRKLLTDDEFAKREKENDLISNSVQAGKVPEAGYWVQHEGVDAKSLASIWQSADRIWA